MAVTGWSGVKKPRSATRPSKSGRRAIDRIGDRNPGEGCAAACLWLILCMTDSITANHTPGGRCQVITRPVHRWVTISQRDNSASVRMGDNLPRG